MRLAAVSPILLALAACAPDPHGPAFVEDFIARSPMMQCTVVPHDVPPASVVRLRAAGDSMVVALAQGDREILLLDGSLTPVRRVAWVSEGPGGLTEPVDVELLGDSVFAVLDRGRSRISLLGLGGDDRGSLRLGMLPHRFLADGDGWLVSSVALLPGHADLLHRVTAEGAEGLGVRPVHMPQPQLKALANSAVIERVGGGRVIVAHQFLVPEAHIVEQDAGRPPVVRRATTPLSEAVREAVGYQPEPPFTDESMARILTPVLEAAPDPKGDGMYVLTRSGRRVAGRWEKALIRVDAEMRYLSSLLLPVNAGPFVVLPGGSEVVLVDEDERWHRCALPDGGAS